MIALALPLLLVASSLASSSSSSSSSSSTDEHVALWQARAESHEAALEWCEASFYRGHALARAQDDVTRYHAFLDAYAADQLRTAKALAIELDLNVLGLDDDATRKVALIVSDLETISVLEDAPCAHTPACGDGLVEGAEMCDATDGCTSTCELVQPPQASQAPRAPRAPAVVATTTSQSMPPATPVASRPHGLLVAGVIVTGAGLAAAGTGAALAWSNDQTLADPLTTGPFKQRALDMRTGSLVAMGIGAAVAVAGGITWGLAPQDHGHDDVVTNGDKVAAGQRP
jgi:hypothetical protein